MNTVNYFTDEFCKEMEPSLSEVGLYMVYSEIEYSAQRAYIIANKSTQNPVEVLEVQPDEDIEQFRENVRDYIKEYLTPKTVDNEDKVEETHTDCKIIRDFIDADGSFLLKPEDRKKYLIKKLDEEMDEFKEELILNTTEYEMIEEAADVLQVMTSLLFEYKRTTTFKNSEDYYINKIVEMLKSKRKIKGSFRTGRALKV